MQSQKVWFLKNYDLFRDIPEEDIMAVAGDVLMKECDQEECPIYHPMQEAGHIYIVKKGEVVLYHQHNDKRFIFDTLGPGSIFGHLKTNDEARYGHHALGSTGSCVCIFSEELFMKLISAYPEVSLRFIRDMSEKVAEYQSQFQAHHQTAEELVYHELVRLNEKRQQNFFNKVMPRPLRATHEQIAELTGLNRVTVTKVMNRLREQNKITYDPKTGIITIV